jgi:hypothetical protein
LSRRFLSLLAIASIIYAADAPNYHPIASGWTAPDSADYQAVIDPKVAHGGRSSLYLKSTTPNAKGYAVRQLIRADAYRGKRIRLSGWLKPNNAQFGTALWLRVDMRNGDYVLDSMLGLNPKDVAANQNGWVRCDLAADVPGDAVGIGFGVRMNGSGEIWADDLSITVVDTSVATTTIERRPYRGPGKDAAIERMNKQYAATSLHPVNMGFEER